MYGLTSRFLLRHDSVVPELHANGNAAAGLKPCPDTNNTLQAGLRFRHRTEPHALCHTSYK